MKTATTRAGMGQGGFALLSAIAVLVFLMVLGGYLARISTRSQVAAARDLVDYRVKHFARAGLDWGLYQMLMASGGSLSCGTTAPAAAQEVTAFATDQTGQPAIFGPKPDTVHVFVQCLEDASSPYDEAGRQVHMYTLTATACNAPACLLHPVPSGYTAPSVPPDGYVERSVSATVSR